jgi:hypothetical protein
MLLSWAIYFAVTYAPDATSELLYPVGPATLFVLLVGPKAVAGVAALSLVIILVAVAPPAKKHKAVRRAALKRAWG